MFGKTSNDQFIMSVARKAGNAKGPKTPPMAKKKSVKASPLQSKAGMKGRDNAGALGFIDQTKG